MIADRERERYFIYLICLGFFTYQYTRFHLVLVIQGLFVLTGFGHYAAFKTASLIYRFI